MDGEGDEWKMMGKPEFVWARAMYINVSSKLRMDGLGRPLMTHVGPSIETNSPIDSDYLALNAGTEPNM